MRYTWDDAKRLKTLEERGLDFRDAPTVLSNKHSELLDDRFDYGEQRFITYGFLDERPVVIVWTPRGHDRRIISMRHAHERELKTQRRTLD